MFVNEIEIKGMIWVPTGNANLKWNSGRCNSFQRIYGNDHMIIYVDLMVVILITYFRNSYILSLSWSIGTYDHSVGGNNI